MEIKPVLMRLNSDFEEMLICAERYAIGRHTYVPDDVMGYITCLIPNLSDNTLYVIATDIAEEIRRYERMNWQLSYRKAWQELLNAVREEIEKRKETTNNA